ncbi:hypothetical protein HanRHA438_Chr03g0141641 [Helianthus annuus]|nr:hypothetical protein HanRHA438_Chr03g0141641 [Helianthus annuus]
MILFNFGLVVVIVAVLVIAVVTLCVAGLLFYCYVRNFGLAGTQNNEKSLVRSTNGCKSQNGNIEDQSNGQMDARVSVDSGPHVKAVLMLAGQNRLHCNHRQMEVLRFLLPSPLWW